MDSHAENAEDNEFNGNSYNQAALEREVVRLMADDDVQRKIGIYEYLLSGGRERRRFRYVHSRNRRSARHTSGRRRSRRSGACRTARSAPMELEARMRCGHDASRRWRVTTSCRGHVAARPSRRTCKCFADIATRRKATSRGGDFVRTIISFPTTQHTTENMIKYPKMKLAIAMLAAPCAAEAAEFAVPALPPPQGCVAEASTNIVIGSGAVPTRSLGVTLSLVGRAGSENYGRICIIQQT